MRRGSDVVRTAVPHTVHRKHMQDLRSNKNKLCKHRPKQLSVVRFNELPPHVFETFCVSSSWLHYSYKKDADCFTAIMTWQRDLSQTFRLPGNSSDTSDRIWTFLFLSLLSTSCHCDSFFLSFFSRYRRFFSVFLTLLSFCLLHSYTISHLFHLSFVFLLLFISIQIMSLLAKGLIRAENLRIRRRKWGKWGWWCG